MKTGYTGTEYKQTGYTGIEQKNGLVILGESINTLANTGTQRMNVLVIPEQRL